MNLLQLVCHEEAITILKFMAEQLANDMETKQLISTYRDAHLGSQAIHLAATTGNIQIIEILMEQFLSDANQLTLGKQSVHHCAAQRNNGIVSIFVFNRCHGIQVNSVDKKGATALHFAIISLQLKNVQALIKLGANPNA